MKRKNKIIKNSLLCVLLVLAGVLSTFAINMYLDKVDAESKKIINETDTAYTTKNNKINKKGLYVAELKTELDKNFKDTKDKSLTYKFDGEEFYLNIGISKDEEGNNNYSILKIAHPEFGINARMNMTDIVSIEYRTGNKGEASVLKLNTAYNSDYFALLDGTYYFLGNDIESINYIDGQFYYVTYNPNYTLLEEKRDCSKETKNLIDGFDNNDYYYKYGKINFLTDYYQKLSSKVYTVKEKCSEFTEE